MTMQTPETTPESAPAVADAAVATTPAPAPQTTAPVDEVEVMALTVPTAQQSADEALYDRWARQVQALYEAGRERGREGLEAAMAAAHRQFESAGEFTAERGNELRQFFERDIDQTVGHFRQLGQEASERLAPSRLEAGALSSLAAICQAAGSAFLSLSRRAESSLSYGTGEITTAGSLTCQGCGKVLRMRKTGHIPPCPGCSGTRFRKGY